MNDLVLTDVAPDPGFAKAVEKAIADAERPVPWWHWLHRWSRWKTYRAGGFNALVAGGQLRQSRTCVRCGRTQDDTAEVDR